MEPQILWDDVVSPDANQYWLEKVLSYCSQLQTVSNNINHPKFIHKYYFCLSDKNTCKRFEQVKLTILIFVSVLDTDLPIMRALLIFRTEFRIESIFDYPVEKLSTEFQLVNKQHDWLPCQILLKYALINLLQIGSYPVWHLLLFSVWSMYGAFFSCENLEICRVLILISSSCKYLF